MRSHLFKTESRNSDAEIWSNYQRGVNNRWNWLFEIVFVCNIYRPFSPLKQLNAYLVLGHADQSDCSSSGRASIISCRHDCHKVPLIKSGIWNSSVHVVLPLEIKQCHYRSMTQHRTQDDLNFQQSAEIIQLRTFATRVVSVLYFHSMLGRGFDKLL